MTQSVARTSTEQKKALVRAYFDEINKHNAGVLEGRLVADYVDHNPPPFPGLGTGLEGLKKVFQTFWDATPGHHVIEDQIAEGDKVVTRLTAIGKHENDLPGIPHTGADLKMTATVMHRIENGKLEFEGLFEPWD